MVRDAEPTAVVVGGGITGLTCAWRLRRAGVDVLCLESSGRPGGVLCTRRIDGFLLEAGPNTVQETAELGELVREAGLESAVLRAAPDLPRFVYRRGSLHPLPRGFISALRTTLVSARGKWRLLGELAVPRRPSTDEESVEAFVLRRFGGEVLDALVAPFISGTFAGDPSQLSARAVLPALVALEERHGGVLRGMLARSFRARPRDEPRGRLLSFRDGLESLPRQLAEGLGGALLLNSEARAISRDAASGRFAIEVRDSTGRRRLTTRAVVVACSLWRAAPLLEALTPATSRALAEIDSAPLVIVSVSWPRGDVSRPLRGIGFLVSAEESVRTLGCLWNSSMFPGRAPEGQASFTAFLGGARDPQAVSLADDALLEIVSKELGEILGARGRPRPLAIERYASGIPQYSLGHTNRVAQLTGAVATVPGLCIAGNYLSGVSVGECVRQGSKAASEVRGLLGGAVDFPSPSM